MTTHIKPDLYRQGPSRLPALDWRAIIAHKPQTRAGQYIRSRYPVPAGHADLIAALAGLGSGADA